ncbi:MAG TPA: FAD-binding protein [Jatrophihabitans sp.]|nr:FAD-binding protein [Jatrophihabitans sp.]
MAEQTSAAEPIRNWAGNVTFTPAELHRPASLTELQSLVARHEKVKVLGTGHSFNRIADTDGALVSLRDLPQVLELDTDRRLVRLGAGVRYGELAAFLHAHGLALPNLGSLPHISVAGACATGTHGSGDANPVLAAAVRAQRLVTGDGELVELAAGDPDFDGTVVALGALGAVTELTLQAVPAFELRQYVYDALPFDQLTADLAEITAAAHSVSLFTRWRGDAVQAWLKSREPRTGDFHGARPADGPRHPMPDGDAGSATQQLGVPGPWHRRLPHFRLEFTPSHGEEIQSEYFVDRAHGAAAVETVRSLGELLAPVLLVGELRTIAADEFWLSPCYQRDRLALHFTWARDPAAVAPVLAELERRLAEFDAVPHWGKEFATAPHRLAELHPRLADFAALARRFDRAGTFGNDFLHRRVLGGL